MADYITVPFDTMEMGSGSASLMGHMSRKLPAAESNEPGCHRPEESAGEAPQPGGRNGSSIAPSPHGAVGAPGQDVKSIPAPIYRGGGLCHADQTRPGKAHLL